MGNQIIAHQDEPQRARSEVRASVPLVRKRHKAANGAEYLLTNAAGCKWVVLRDVFSEISNVLGCEGMKGKALICAHSDECCLNSSSSRRFSR